jgi:hypothetical protein
MTESSNALEAGSRTGWMETYTGVRFFPLEPRAADVRSVDIAHSLSNQCRYAGHSRFNYSVAQHSVLLCDWVLRNGNPADPHETMLGGYAFTALMHDCAEAYLCDLPRPIKYRSPEFLKMEAELERVVFPVFNLEYPIPPWMKAIDSRIVVDEREQVTSRSGHEWSTDGLKPLGIRIRRWSNRKAERKFLQRFHYLHNGMSSFAAWRAARRQVRRGIFPGRNRMSPILSLCVHGAVTGHCEDCA